MFCIETEHWDAGCNETNLNIVAKVQNVSCSEWSKKKKVKQQQRKNDSIYWMIERYCDMILHLKEMIIRVIKKLWYK